MAKSNRLTIIILIAMVLGIVVGHFIHKYSSPQFIADFSRNIKLLSTVFLRLVQMIIAPLVFTTMVVGIAKLGDLKTVGRVGGKALLWFVCASFASLFLGMLLVNYFQPGATLNPGERAIAAATDLMGEAHEFSLASFVEHLVPKSVVEAMSTNAILQIVLFSVFFGIAATAIGEPVKPLIKSLDIVSHVILKMVDYVMKFAPIVVF